MEWMKSKFFWLNVIVIIILVLQYTINNQLAPASWVPYETMFVVVLNAIAGMIISQQVTALKRQLNKKL